MLFNIIIRPIIFELMLLEFIYDTLSVLIGIVIKFKDEI